MSEHSISAATQTEFTGTSLVALVTEMTEAARVDILGVLPRALGEALLAFSQRDQSDGAPAGPPSELLYLTPSRERVAAYRHEKLMGRVVQRWSAGWGGFRNWADRRKGELDSAEIRLIDDLFLECIVICHSPGRQPRVWVLTLLPQPNRPTSPEATAPEGLVLTEVEAASVDGVLARIDDLRATGEPLVDRGLICTNATGRTSVGADAGQLPDEFVPVITDFRQMWRVPQPAGVVLPVCVVALHSTITQGPGLLLLHRNPFNSRNDFDTLSMLSERVSEEDFAQAASRTLPDLPPGTDLLDAWWMLLGKPHRMDVPRGAFVAAGQREVFISCGLDLPVDRFTYCGSHLVEREDLDQSLGFFGFRVVLQRDEKIDELSRAKRWNSDLVFILADDLYRPRNDAPDPRARLPLNRLLSKRPDWVKSTLIGGAQSADEAAVVPDG